MVYRFSKHRSKFFSQLAHLLEEMNGPGLPVKVADVLLDWIPVQSVVILEFCQGVQPRLLAHCGDTRFESDLRAYLNGVYLLDPFFNIFQTSDRRGVIHISTNSVDEFQSPRDYKSYFQHLRAQNEVGGLYDISDDTCIHISMVLRDKGRNQVDKVVNLMEDLESLISSIFKLHMAGAEASNTARKDLEARGLVHAKVVEEMTIFGAGILTDRETEIAQFLLRGHSAKSMARLLDLSPGTVSIHRSNVYRKMGVNSQAELSSSFILQLLGSAETGGAQA